MPKTHRSTAPSRRHLAGKASALLVALLVGHAPLAAASCIDETSAMSTVEAPLDRLITEGEALMASGLAARGLIQLEHAAALADRQAEPTDKARAFGAYGHGLMLRGDNDRAMDCLEASLEIAGDHRLTALEALAHLNIGTLHTREKRKRRNALENLVLAEEKAREAGRLDLAARALLNRARLAIDVVGNADDAVSALGDAAAIIDGLQNERQRASLLVTLGATWADDFLNEPEGSAYDGEAYAALNEALVIAAAHDLPRETSSGLGELADLYGRQDRLGEAMTLLDQAIVEARQIDDNGLTQRWYWRRAALHQRRGDRSRALDDYARAVDVINHLRKEAALADSVLGRKLLDDAQILFADYVDMLFAAEGAALTQGDLKRIQAIVEQQRQVEVESYFQDQCVADLQSRIKDIQSEPERGTAFLYPIFSNQRLILMTNIEGKLGYDDRPVDEAELAADVRRIRRSLEVSNSSEAEYLPALQKLHDLLIVPIMAELAAADIDTLVIVPSGPLRGVPFAALHDGEDFLIQRYAVAIAPGLSLLDSEALASSPAGTLLGGLTNPVEGFDPLPFAKVEVERIHGLRGGTVLTGDDFASGGLRQSLAAIPFSVVHLASHAKFGGSRSDTFILTQDGKIDLDQLEDLMTPSAFRDRPVELLTLSACETAKGDELEQAALGLAGIAVKAGARSALGTLWPVFDNSSPEFMGIFYENIGPGGLSKAKALQQAQVSMLDGDQFSHPAFWAPYLLIGSWI